MNQQYFAAINNSESELLTSSSGGVFIEIAKCIIDLGGVVYGAAFTDDFHVEHIRAESLKDLERLKGSKYVQSRLNDTYEQVERDLISHKNVLFSGTPCQCFGLTKYLVAKKCNYDKLILVDFICHGTPNPIIFEKYLYKLKKKYKSNIVYFTFRNKRRNNVQSILVKFENGKEYYGKASRDFYYQGFSYNYTILPGCFSCKFTSYERITDITLGDFWNYSGNLDKTKGISELIINTTRGFDIFRKIDYKFNYEKKQKEEAVQISLIRPICYPMGYKFIRKVMETTNVWILPKMFFSFHRLINHIKIKRR